MAKNLVIVESPAKAKTINKYLGNEYKVLASIGHIKDLPSKGLGVDIENNFEPTYEVIPDVKKRNNKKTVSDLKKAAKEADTIFLAADPDREGEAICQHLAEEIVPKRPAKQVFRVMFNEITKNAIKDAFKMPRQINKDLVDAQQARRILDRLVGYKVSPILWKNIGGKLSAGRVQTVAVRLVVEREREIEAFKQTEYWTIAANLSAKLPPNFDARLYKIEDLTLKTSGFEQDLKKNETHIKDEKTANEIVEEAGKENFVVDSVTTKERKRNPVPSFITSKLQQEAARKLGFSVKRTMTTAQKLYEGVEIGSEGAVGLITYMRTDSTRVSDAALNEARDFIGGNYGKDYLPEKPNFYKSKKGAQDAHEAIRPTDANRTPDSLRNYLSADELKLYSLIWKRFVASQMTPAIFDQTTIDIKAGRFTFRATGSVQKFDGFLKVYQEGRDEKPENEEDEDAELTLPKVEKGENLKLNKITPEQHFTEPPPRFTEATLVKALEEKGIGRPSTYAAIMTTIQDREYVEKLEGRFHPTGLGMTVNDVLVAGFDDLFNPTYTARMEDQLDEIEEGKINWRDALRGFYDKFSVDLKNAEISLKDKKKASIPTDEVCENCGAGMVIKFGRFGQFLACANYPECKTTREVSQKRTAVGGQQTANGEDQKSNTGDQTEEVLPCENCGREMALKRGRFGAFYGCTGYPDCKNIRKIDKKSGATTTVAPPVELDEICPVDGAKLVIRTGRFGEFTSCANYPKCKYIKRETLGIACPKCNTGEIAVKKSRRGKSFYGCTNYPKCDAVFWDKPINEPCPQCNAPFILEKYTKKDGATRYCQNEGCDYKISVGDSIIGSDTESKISASVS
ncbi:MAG: type I DNA topoisomerase [Acidobacteria bacterium]|nr:type I DNA topoisomerase [Acidobacteriota bacterium]MCA1639747.1 type I DNA topoisomerase [Acidobacteriota bacterium]